MQYNIKLDLTLDSGALSQLLTTLDGGPHRLVRGIIDSVIDQARAQDAAQAAPTPEEPVGGTD